MWYKILFFEQYFNEGYCEVTDGGIDVQDNLCTHLSGNAISLDPYDSNLDVEDDLIVLMTFYMDFFQNFGGNTLDSSDLAYEVTLWGYIFRWRYRSRCK